MSVCGSECVCVRGKGGGGRKWWAGVKLLSHKPEAQPGSQTSGPPGQLLSEPGAV